LFSGAGTRRVHPVRASGAGTGPGGAVVRLS